VVDSFIFFIYTGCMYDVRGKNMSHDMDRSTLCNPRFDFDLVELFTLADYFGASDLVEIMTETFFGTRVMFPHSASSHERSERVMARILDKCDGLHGRALLHPFAGTYAQGTGGLRCLCNSPLRYPMNTWKVLMESASRFDILWMAHVLPLYVLRFALDRREAMALLWKLDLWSWVDGSRKKLSLRELVKEIHPSHMFDMKTPGNVSITSGTPMQM
jgi:hypothetical protein